METSRKTLEGRKDKCMWMLDFKDECKSSEHLWEEQYYKFEQRFEGRAFFSQQESVMSLYYYIFACFLYHCTTLRNIWSTWRPYVQKSVFPCMLKGDWKLLFFFVVFSAETRAGKKILVVTLWNYNCRITEKKQTINHVACIIKHYHTELQKTGKIWHSWKLHCLDSSWQWGETRHKQLEHLVPFGPSVMPTHYQTSAALSILKIQNI